MDKDRIEGAAKQAKGAVKEAVGRAVGDGKLQNTVGGLKDTLRRHASRTAATR